MSIRNKIKQSGDLETRIVAIPEWDVEIEVRSLSARQRASLQSMLGDETIEAGVRQETMWSFLLTECCFDPADGTAVFQPEDMEWLFTEKGFGPIDRLASECLGVSAVVKKEADELGKSS